MILPYRVEVIYPQAPVSNIFIIVVTVVIYFLTPFDHPTLGFAKPFILYGWNFVGMFGHVFLHAGFLHMAFNMYFLWVFGNAICSKFGNTKYILLYFFCAFWAAVVHNIFSGHPGIGASGAINGVIGFYLALYPRNKIDCLYILAIVSVIGASRSFTIRGKYLIVFWLISDLIGALMNKGGIAYWAHIGGFMAGLLLGLMSLKMGWVEMDEADLPALFEKNIKT